LRAMGGSFKAHLRETNRWGMMPSKRRVQNLLQIKLADVHNFAGRSDGRKFDPAVHP
jgi:hypothetical protein